MTWTLTELQTASYFDGGFAEMRVLNDVLEDLHKANVSDVVAVLPADESCVLYWVDAEKGEVIYRYSGLLLAV